MNALELRKGNIIQDSKGRYLQVHEILEANLRAWHDLDVIINQLPFNSPDKDDFSYEECSGVDLTPEILEKCGFVRTMGNFYRFKEEKYPYQFRLSIRDTNETKYLYMHNDFVVGTHIMYLHQLQNRYYSLTGIDLDVNM